jgi:hypothetical protein
LGTASSAPSGTAAASRASGMSGFRSIAAS